MKIKHPFRLALTSVTFIVISLFIILEIIRIQNTFDSSKIDQIQFNEKVASRGNIYSHDYKFLAVNAIQYDLRLDAVYASKFSKKDLKQLSQDLSKIFNTNINYFKLIQNAKKNNNKYLLLKQDISLTEIERLKKTSYFKKNISGGLIINEEMIRKNPSYAQRTIGHLYKNSKPKYGLEYSYNNALMGRNGSILQVHDPGAEPRNINSPNNVDPIDGKDLITTIDLDLQDIVHEALLRQLEIYEASFGTSIVMDVKSGAIRAISNLKKIKNNKYAEVLNFAVAHKVEPGSTFKLASLMAYFEDSNATVEDSIDCKNGLFRFGGAPIDTKDSHPMSVVSIKEAFAKSSNIGFGRLIQNYYNQNPQKFIDRLYTFGLGDKSKIDLHGIPKPYIPSPKDDNWSLISLPWMSYGYGLEFTPLDLLTFYNAVANNGVIVHPYLGDYLLNGSKKKKIVNNHLEYNICSDNTVKKLQILLQEVVDNGTAKSLSSLPFYVSGKTGTAVTNPTDSIKKYHASFIGFFPSEKPLYSCIVLIDDPNVNIGYYGSKVAVPVFEEIAQKIYSFEGNGWQKRSSSNHVSNQNTKNLNISSNIAHLSPESMIEFCQKNPKIYPDLVGYHISEAIYILESRGLEYMVDGEYGHVIKQYPKAKSQIQSGLAMTLFI